MENRSVKSTQTEQLEQWVNNAVVSLSASLVFGRDKASQIAQPLLIALFTLTDARYGARRCPALPADTGNE